MDHVENETVDGLVASQLNRSDDAAAAGNGRIGRAGSRLR